MATTDPESTRPQTPPKPGDRLLCGLALATGGLVAFDLVLILAGYDKHPHFPWERLPGSYALLGALFSLVLLAAARLLRRPLAAFAETVETVELDEAAEAAEAVVPTKTAPTDA
jgi:hypothetical protein